MFSYFSQNLFFLQSNKSQSDHFWTHLIDIQYKHPPQDLLKE